MDRQKDALIRFAQEVADMAHGDLASRDDQNAQTLQAMIVTARDILGIDDYVVDLGKIESLVDGKDVPAAIVGCDGGREALCALHRGAHVVWLTQVPGTRWLTLLTYGADGDVELWRGVDEGDAAAAMVTAYRAIMITKG